MNMMDRAGNPYHLFPASRICTQEQGADPILLIMERESAVLHHRKRRFVLTLIPIRVIRSKKTPYDTICFQFLVSRQKVSLGIPGHPGCQARVHFPVRVRFAVKIPVLCAQASHQGHISSCAPAPCSQPVRTDVPFLCIGLYEAYGPFNIPDRFRKPNLPCKPVIQPNHCKPPLKSCKHRFYHLLLALVAGHIPAAMDADDGRERPLSLRQEHIQLLGR